VVLRGLAPVLISPARPSCDGLFAVAPAREGVMFERHYSNFNRAFLYFGSNSAFGLQSLLAPPDIAVLTARKLKFVPQLDGDSDAWARCSRRDFLRHGQMTIVLIDELRRGVFLVESCQCRTVFRRSVEQRLLMVTPYRVHSGGFASLKSVEAVLEILEMTRRTVLVQRFRTSCISSFSSPPLLFNSTHFFAA